VPRRRRQRAQLRSSRFQAASTPRVLSPRPIARLTVPVGRRVSRRATRTASRSTPIACRTATVLRRLLKTVGDAGSRLTRRLDVACPGRGENSRSPTAARITHETVRSSGDICTHSHGRASSRLNWLGSIAPSDAGSIGLVFPSPHGHVWRPDNFRNRVFYPARRRAGFDDLTFHDLRHTCASLMIAAGANPLEVAEQLRHRDAQLVFKRYGHLYPGASKSAALRLDSVTGPALDVGQVWGSLAADEDDEEDSPANEEWSVPGSNRRPPACKAGALPAELTPRGGGQCRGSPEFVAVSHKPSRRP
jgi:hypothetical protein